MVQRQLRAEEERERRDEARAQKERERDQKAAHREARETAAALRTEELADQVSELKTVLLRSATRPRFDVTDLDSSELEPFDPGLDAVPARAPVPPTPERGGLFGRRRARQWFEHQKEQYEAARTAFEQAETARVERLTQRRTEYQRRVDERAAARHERVRRVGAGVLRAERDAVEELVSAAVEAIPALADFRLEPRVVYLGHPREVFVEIRLPDHGVVPSQKSVAYVVSRDADAVKERPATERESLYRSLLAQLPLAVIDGVLRALDAEVVETVAVTGRLTFIDPATGRRVEDVLVSVIADRATVDELVLSSPELDPVRCLRSLGARLSDHPLARETVPAFLTFDEAKYKLGPSVSVAAGLDGRPHLGTMPWPDFEQLVRELLLAMQGHDTRVTRGSRDDGIDGVVFDCHAALGGEYIVQAKRYNKVVPALDVRALAGTMHDKRANHALFVTTSWFSPDGRRFAGDNRVRLIEGTELRHLLLDHLELDVLVPQPPRRRSSSQGRQEEG